MTATIAAVVLAGGASRRFGADKLAALVDGVPLLHRAVTGLPDDWPVIIVGPQRPLPRPARFVREDPPGGGPAAGLVAGARAAIATGATVISTLPGDAPCASAAARLLAARLTGEPAAVTAVIGTDGAGVDQPLQLAVRGAALQRLAARTDAHNLSARRLLDELLAGQTVRLRLPAALTADIDVPEDLAALPTAD